MVIIIECIYEEFKPETYQGMQAQDPQGMMIRFTSSDPRRDFLSCLNYLYALGYRPGQVMTSSSVDHFFSDKRGSHVHAIACTQ